MPQPWCVVDRSSTDVIEGSNCVTEGTLMLSVDIEGCFQTSGRKLGPNSPEYLLMD